MLTELKLTNFRLFDDEVTVRFRPITILIGKNSSGKSSIIKFLLMLQQSLDPGRSQFLTPDGEKVSLGAFAALKNTITNRRNLDFHIRVRDTTEQPNELLSLYLNRIGKSAFNEFIYTAGGSAPYGKSAYSPRSRFSVLDRSSEVDLFTFENRMLEGLTFWRLPPQFELDEYEGIMERDQGNSNSQVQRRIEISIELMAKNEVISSIGYQFESLKHLLPVRDDSNRVLLSSSPPSDNVGQRGQHALPHLQQIVDENDDQFAFIRPHIENIAGVEGISFKTTAGYVTRAMATNRSTGAEVLIADFGFGVGQALPVIVQGAIMDPHTTLMVEQPEAQLHPTAQLELGSFFADLWKERNVASIIETHSDNILLRLRRLIAKGDLSHENVSVAYFTFDENNRNMPVIKNLDINEDGSMESGLPMEFFGENVFEALKLGAKR